MTTALLPQAFLDFITPHLPKDTDLAEFVNACQRPLRRSIRVNTLKISVQEFISRAQELGWELEPIPWCDTGFWLNRSQQQEDAIPLGNTAEHLLGLFYIQEASSMLPPQALLQHQQMDSDTCVLDMAAAPGSKTSQIAALMQNQGLLIANEYAASRLKVLVGTIQRLGITNTALTHFDGRVYSHLAEQFDYVLLDAPCSGEGTVRKDPQAMQNWSVEHVNEIAATQTELMDAAFQSLKVGGKLVYSTCSINPVENQQVCAALKQKYGAAVEFEDLSGLYPQAKDCITPEGFLHVWPHVYDSEGFFVAAIKKTASVPHQPLTPNYKLKSPPFKHASKKQQQEFSAYLKQQFALDLPDGLSLYVRDNEFWLFPAHIDSFLNRIRFHRIGTKAAELHRKGFRLSHDFAMACQFSQNSKMQELDLQQLKQWFQGRDVNVQEAKSEGDVIVSFRGFSAGAGRWQKQKIKNSLPRELVRDNRVILND